MSDRFPAQIWIGGKVSKAERLYPDDLDDKTTILAGLVGALNEDGASYEYGYTPISGNCTDTLILYSEYLDDDSLLHLKNDQAVNDEIVDGEVVRKGLEFIEKFEKNHGPPNDPNDWEDLTTGISLLRGVCPKLPPKLESFEIIW